MIALIRGEDSATENQLIYLKEMVAIHGPADISEIDKEDMEQVFDMKTALSVETLLTNVSLMGY